MADRRCDRGVSHVLHPTSTRHHRSTQVERSTPEQAIRGRLSIPASPSTQPGPASKAQHPSAARTVDLRVVGTNGLPVEGLVIDLWHADETGTAASGEPDALSWGAGVYVSTSVSGSAKASEGAGASSECGDASDERAAEGLALADGTPWVESSVL